MWGRSKDLRALPRPTHARHPTGRFRSAAVRWQPGTVVIRVDPTRLRAYQMSSEEVIKAVAAGNMIFPAGDVRIKDLNRLAPRVLSRAADPRTRRFADQSWCGTDRVPARHRHGGEQ